MTKYLQNEWHYHQLQLRSHCKHVSMLMLVFNWNHPYAWVQPHRARTISGLNYYSRVFLYLGGIFDNQFTREHVLPYKNKQPARSLLWIYFLTFLLLLLSTPDSVAADSCVKQWRNFWHWLGVTRQCKQMSSSLLWEKRHPWPCHG